MPRNAGTGVFTRVSNSFSNPVFGTLIDPTDADALFDDQDVGLNPPQLAGPVEIIGALSATTTMTAASYNKVTVTAPATSATLTLIDGTVLTGPAASGTVMTLGNAETVTGVKAFASGSLRINGASSGQTILNATAVASGTLTFPAVTDTVVCKSTIDTLTGKTFDTAGASNSFLINGVAVTANTGTGAVARAAGPTFTTPALGVATATSINGSSIAPGQYTGEPSNASATAGNIGEYIETILASGSATALTTTVSKTITSLTLSAGDWDVSGTVYFLPSSSPSITLLSSSLSLVTNTSDTTPGRLTQMPMAAVVGAGPSLSSSLPPYRFSVSGSTTIFLVGTATFTNSLSGFGIIRARRVR